MKRLKIIIKPTSSFISQLHSDTIFGQFCWMLRDLFGEDVLTTLLKDYAESPYVVFSSAFPSGRLPVPVLPSAGHEVIEKIIKQRLPKEDPELAAGFLGKTFKKNSLIKWQDLQEAISDTLSPKSLISNYIKGLECKDGKLTGAKASVFSVTEPIFKNSINRHTGTTVKGGANLYHFNETFHAGDISNLDIYAVFDETKISSNQIGDVLALIGKTGFGKDKSTGKGRFELVNIIEEPEELQSKCETPNAFISLSYGIPDADSSLLYGKTITKFGKHGGNMAVQGRHMKNPVIMFQPGSTFSFEKFKPLYGMGLELDPLAKGHFHSAWMIPVFCRLEVDNV